MTNRKLKRVAHTLIFKEEKSHKEAYEQLLKESQDGPEALAKLLSTVPSRARHLQSKQLWVAYIALLSLIILLRLTYIIIATGDMLGSAPEIVLIIVAIGIAIPVYGIVGVLRGSTGSLTTVPIFLIVHFLRGMGKSRAEFGIDQAAYIALILGVGILAYLIHSKWKTPYTKHVVEDTSVDFKKKKLKFTFDEAEKPEDDLLDGAL